MKSRSATLIVAACALLLAGCASAPTGSVDVVMVEQAGVASSEHRIRITDAAGATIADDTLDAGVSTFTVEGIPVGPLQIEVVGVCTLDETLTEAGLDVDVRADGCA